MTYERTEDHLKQHLKPITQVKQNALLKVISPTVGEFITPQVALGTVAQKSIPLRANVGFVQRQKLVLLVGEPLGRSY